MNNNENNGMTCHVLFFVAGHISRGEMGDPLHAMSTGQGHTAHQPPMVKIFNLNLNSCVVLSHIADYVCVVLFHIADYFNFCVVLFYIADYG